MSTVPISELEPLEEGAVSEADELVIVDKSASATKKVTTLALISDTLKQLPPASIPGNIFQPTEGAGSVGEIQLQDRSVTAQKLADGSSGKFLTSLDGVGTEGSFVGQVGSFNAAGYMWNGVTWRPISERASFTGSINDFLRTSLNSFDNTIEIETEFVNDRNYAGRYLGYDANGEITATTISASNIDKATDVSFGVCRVPDGKGLKINNGDIEIDNSIAPKTLGGLHSVAYDGTGLITGSRPYAEGDLPYASATIPGVVKIGTGLRVSGNGTVSIVPGEIDISVPIATSVSPGTVMPLRNRGLTVDVDGGTTVTPYTEDPNANTVTKITYDSNGLITGGAFLEAADIPPLDFEQITTGTLDGDRIATRSIPRTAFEDFAITFVQEGEPPVSSAGSAGTFWYKESTRILRVYTGTRWAQVGAGGGTSTATLEWAGFIDANTGLITQVTSIGQNNGGFVVGQGLPAASDELTGYYVIAIEAGNGISETPDNTYSENDWCICLGLAEGWQYLEQDAGGGGGSATLQGLLDTEIDLAGTGHVLTYNDTTGKWQNSQFLSGQQNGTKIQHKYSDVLLEDPTISDLEPGEFWLNIHSTSPTLYLRTYDTDNGTERLSQWSSDDSLIRVEDITLLEPLYNATDPGVSDPARFPTIGIREATTSAPGAMSAADKLKLNELDVNAVSGVMGLTAEAPVVLTDTDTQPTGQNYEISVDVVTNTSNGLMLATDKIILDTLATATQIQSDFNSTNTSSAAYIKNKPGAATSATDGYMSAADKAKLDTIQENANVGITDAPNDGQQYARRNNSWTVVTQATPGAQVVVNNIPPGGASQGDLWLDNTTGELHVYYNDGDSSQWINTSTAGGGIYTEGIARPPQIGGNPPVDARAGDFWLDSRSGILYIYYPDGDSEQWIACSSGNSGGGTSVNGNTPIGAEPPQNPVYGDTWIDPDTLALYVYFNDGGSDQWAQVTTVSAGNSGPAFTEDPPTDPLTGDLWIRPTTLKQYVYTGSAWASVICC